MYTSQLMQKICRKINLKRPAFYNVPKILYRVSCWRIFEIWIRERNENVEYKGYKDSCALVGDTFEFVDENLNGIFF